MLRFFECNLWQMLSTSSGGHGSVRVILTDGIGLDIGSGRVRVPCAPQVTPPETTLSPHICWARNPGVVLQTRADSAFLGQPGKQVIWHLNALGLAIWALLEIPGAAAELGAALHEHFPEMSPGTLTRDANALLDALARASLLHENAVQPNQA